MSAPVTRYRLGPWGRCIVCGEQTRTMSRPDPAVPEDDGGHEHMLCVATVMVRVMDRAHDHWRRRDRAAVDDAAMDLIMDAIMAGDLEVRHAR